VIIRHHDDLFSSMSHLKKDSVKVSEGERVKEGDIIGRCGNSGRSPYPHLHFQLQHTPYIGSPTLDYPLSYYILNQEKQFMLQSFEKPGKDALVSNIEINGLLHNAFHFIPGKKMNFQVDQNGQTDPVTWEVQTDPFNNTFIKCLHTRSVAWFRNDGNLLYFTHYEGDKKALLYYFFLASYKVQQGYYQDMVLRDLYPLNLLFRPPLLTLQDMFAPFWKFLSSEFWLKYSWIDNEMSPTEIKLEATVRNMLIGRELKRITLKVTINEAGISEIQVNGPRLNIVSRCTD
jgi:hypothetical protein